MSSSRNVKISKDCPFLAKEDNRPASNSHYLKIENDYKIKKTFGFIALPSLPILDNMKLVLKNMTKNEYFNKMNTNSYHNLCTTASPPQNVGSLLSLGMKFCIKTQYPKKDSLDKAFVRFQRDVRLRYFFADGIEKEDPLDPFNPSLYIPSDWSPPLANNDIETRISSFHKLLASTRNDIIRNTHSSTNLTPSQLFLLDWLKDNPKFIILDTDKNWVLPLWSAKSTSKRCLNNISLILRTTHSSLKAKLPHLWKISLLNSLKLYTLNTEMTSRKKK